MLEKRKWPREACLQRCVVYKGSAPDEPTHSRVINCSFNGLMLETEAPLRRGEPVHIRLEGDRGPAITDGYRVGLVRWSTGQPQAFSGLFEAGIEVLGGSRADCRRWLADF